MNVAIDYRLVAQSVYRTHHTLRQFTVEIKLIYDFTKIHYFSDKIKSRKLNGINRIASLSSVRNKID